MFYIQKMLYAALTLFTIGAAYIQAQPCGPRIGDKAPAFTADSTQGTITFPDDFKGKWVILFSHPADFTPVCTTEFKRLASMVPEFKKLNTKLLGLSVDSAYTHKIWMQHLNKDLQKHSKHRVNFPVVSDTSMDIARKYGMIHPAASKVQTVRSVYFIDPKGIVRAIFYYPIANGRNFDEIKRLLEALQITDRKNVATPADWRPGKPTIKKEKVAKDILAD